MNLLQKDHYLRLLNWAGVSPRCKALFEAGEEAEQLAVKGVDRHSRRPAVPMPKARLAATVRAGDGVVARRIKRALAFRTSHHGGNYPLDAMQRQIVTDKF